MSHYFFLYCYLGNIDRYTQKKILFTIVGPDISE